MAEADMLSVIQKLETRRVKSSITFPLVNEKVSELINELRTMVEFLRDKKLDKVRRLNYLIDDVIDMVLDLCQLEDDFQVYMMINPIQIWIGEFKMRSRRSGDDEAKSRLENVAEGDNKDMVGLEADIKFLLQRMTFNEEQGLCTSFITGMAGMGKTALARELYNHESVVDGFELRAWVHVSSELSHKEVLMKLILEVCDDLEGSERTFLMEFMKYSDNGSLQQMLHQNLQGVRYFIVLDDFPNEMCLKSIVKALPNKDERSRLLLTSRTKNLLWVYTNLSTFHYIHEMKPLDLDQSWNLFLRTLFNTKLTSEQKFSKQLEKKGKEMLKKCSGMPLAIQEVGRQLSEKRQGGSEWEDLFESSVDFGSTFELLESSYQNLGLGARLCFLHLACIKENATARDEKLTQIWAAGGMVSEKEHETRSYLTNLLVECILQIKDTNSYDAMKSCSINYILHQLCRNKAEEEIGFEIIRNNGNDRPSQSPRHRVIVSSRDEFSYSTNQDKHLVSLFFHGGGYFDSSPSYWKSFEQHRILDFEDFGLKILPETIGTLIELRYLGLRNNYIQELPHSFGLLRKLEVLDIALNFMVEVPNIIWEMEYLHHLYMSDIICRKPLKINGLKNLESLTFISADDWTYGVSGVEAMTSLRLLGIEELDGNSNASKLFASLSKLEMLGTLILRGFRFRNMPCLDDLRVLHSLRSLKLDGLLAKLPSVDDFPPNIVHLKLVNSCLEEDPMPVLEKLSKITLLKLRNAYVGREMVISRDGFPELKILHMEELRNLRNVQVGEGAMQELRRLEIKNCPYLYALLEEIRSMTRLENLKMVTTRKIATKIRKSILFSRAMDVEILP